MAWLIYFIKTQKPLTTKEELQKLGLDEIKIRFKQADSIVNEVLQTLDQHMDEPIRRVIPWREGGDTIEMTPRKLLMHVITHEYHHKGQIVAMMRQMGYEPPNTDVLGTS